MKPVVQYIFTDWEGERFEVSEEDAEESFRTGEFYHPLTGYRVYVFRDKLVRQ